MSLAVLGTERPGRAFPVGDTWYIITSARYISPAEIIAEAEEDAKESGELDYSMLDEAPDGYWNCNVRLPNTDEDYVIVKEEQTILYSKFPEMRPNQ